MTFDFREEGAVYVTMQKTNNDNLEGCGVDKCFATHATDNLFVIRDAPKVTEKEAIWCRSYVAKVLYVAKRVKPECLTAISFLTSRVGAYDIDDFGKVRRLFGYTTQHTTECTSTTENPIAVHTRCLESADRWKRNQESRKTSRNPAPRQSWWRCQTMHRDLDCTLF